MRYAAVLQTKWDMRAAANFMFGGGGGGLLLAAALIGNGPSVRLPAALLGIALMGIGLTMVWLEIGRPWRAVNVMFKPQNSWMTREAYVAGCAFLFAAGFVLLQKDWLQIAAGIAGMAFLYCQARILRAAKGIPAWREPAIVILIVSTGVAEGVAYLAIIELALFGQGGHSLMLLACLVILRMYAWHLYQKRFLAADPPSTVKAVLPRFGSRFVLFGHLLPLLLVAGAYLAPPVGLVSAFIAALLVVVSGLHLKFALVVRMSNLQGYGLGELKRGHPLRLAGLHTVSEASARLRRTRERESRNQGRSQ